MVFQSTHQNVMLNASYNKMKDKTSMSQLTDIIKLARSGNTSMGNIANLLQNYYDKEESRRSFGLVYENHLPEVFEIANHAIRKNDIVSIRSKRGEFAPTHPERYLVTKIYTNDDDEQVANLEALHEDKHSDTQQDILTGVLVDTLIKTISQEEVIYPGLEADDEVIGDDNNDVFHTVISSENYDALRMLNATDLIGKVDCIYIDPPYNTGNKDWIYNNDYVDGSDEFKSSAFMNFLERRLLEAKQLLNKDDSVLILTIDEKEYLNVGKLLEQVFPEARMQMISSIINQSGVSRASEFYRTNEFIYIVQIGDSYVQKQYANKEWALGKNKKKNHGVKWSMLRRTSSNSNRSDSPGCFYPIYTNPDGSFYGIGDDIPLEANREEVVHPKGVEVTWPIKPNGEEGNWQVSPTTFKSHINNGYIKIGRMNDDGRTISYIKRGDIKKIESGEIQVIEKDPIDGHVITDDSNYQHRFVSGTQWNITSHNAGGYGTNLISSFHGEKRFDYPKSLYAVEDALRFFVKNKPNATIIDFFGGSGTTAHAVMRLNEQDGGNRRSITITNNEISLQNNKKFSLQGLQSGDPEWEQYGVYEYATKPRLTAAITGKTAASDYTEDVEGYYKYNDYQDEYPIGDPIPKDKAKQYKDGLQQNVKFFKLTYLTYRDIFLNDADEFLYPLLWLEQGQQGELPDTSEGFFLHDDYGVVKKVSQVDTALKHAGETLRTLYVHCDDAMAAQLQKTCATDVEIVPIWKLYVQRLAMKTIT